MLKKHSQKLQQARKVATPDEADLLAKRLADKPYSDSSQQSLSPVQEKITRTTISLPESLQRQCEDIVIQNKRNGTDPKNVSALIRAALEEYLKSQA
jgi:uncharacterized membrane protein